MPHVVGRIYDGAWHDRARNVAFKFMIAGEREINDVVPDGYKLHMRPVYNSSNVEYDIECRLVRDGNSHPDYIEVYTYLFEHAEPASKFPSEELKTKILLVAG